MTAPQKHAAGRYRPTLLAVLLALQAAAAVFFVADVMADLSVDGMDWHVLFEAFVAVALAIGIVFGGVEMRRTLEVIRRSEAALELARGAFADVLETHFTSWGLTPAEREVALLAIKGFDTSQIAELRASAPGTVRAQLARVYGKAGVGSRAELISLFIEDMLG